MEASVKFTVEQWNVVLDILSDAPVKRAMPLINSIVEQCKAQMGNGVDNVENETRLNRGSES